MRILLYGLNFAPEPTGIGKYSGELAEALRSAGHEIRVVTAPPYYPSWKVAEGYDGFRYRTEYPAPNLRVTRCPLWVPARPSGLTRLLHLFSFALTSLPIIIKQRFWRPQAVILVVPTMFCLPGTLLAFAKSRKTKRIVHVQDLEVDAAFELGLIRGNWMRSLVGRVERWLLNRFDVVTSVSPKMVERLGQKGVRKDKLGLLPNWIHVDDIRPESSQTSYRTDWGLDDRVVALYSGSMGEKQGMEILMEAATALQSNDAIRFVICSEGPAYQRLKMQYNHLVNVVWNGLVPQEQLNELLNTADIHLLPQRGDAADLVMPSKLTGMFAGGRPVVATAQPGTQVADVVTKRGLVVLPESPEALASAIECLARDKALREQLGEAARQYALEHLNGTVILSQFEQRLQQLVKAA
jgi:colanic acid biosynthesis glycosyl transferase WcaI